jgi:hypothetical protein
MHNMMGYDHRKDSLQTSSKPAYSLNGAYAVVGPKTHLFMNSNVADRSIYPHAKINSPSRTLP